MICYYDFRFNIFNQFLQNINYFLFYILKIFSFKKLVKDYEVGEQNGFAGTYGLWQLHNAVHKKTQIPVTIWVIEKKPIEKAFFKKDSQGYKRFIELMKVDGIPPQQLISGPKLYEKLQEDSQYLVFVTERLQGSLQSLYYYYGDLTFAKVNNFNDNTQPPVPFASPDLVLLGLNSLLQDLQNLHSAGVIHGNITPSNIVLTSNNQWKLCGFAYCEAQALQFEFSNDYNSYFRPSAAYMSEKMTRSHCSDRWTDVCQIFNSIYSCFGNKQTYVDMSQLIGKHNAVFSEDSLITNVCEKLHGVSNPGSSESLTPQMAQKIAQQNAQFWNSFQQQAANWYPLKDLAPLCGIINQACADQVGCDVMLNQIASLPLYQLLNSINNAASMGAFQKTNAEIQPVALQMINCLQQFVSRKALSYDFLISTLPNVVKLLAFKDYHSTVIPLLISIADQIQMPQSQVFLLFEPILITLTESKYRSQYPPTKPGPYQAFTGITTKFYEGKVISVLRYVTPYQDYPLEKGYKEKDRNAMCPTVDKEINNGVYDNIISILLSQLQFFLSPLTGGRSHYYTVNFLLSCINSQNDIISASSMNCLSSAVKFMNDENWMIPEDQALSTTLAKQVASIGDKFVGLTEQANQEEQQQQKDNELPKGIQAYKQPLTALITPSIAHILATDGNQTKLYNALLCFASISSYFSDDQLVRIMLPAVNDALDKNISKYPQGITGFSQFVKQIYQRCNGKTVANVFMRSLFKMCYSGVLTEQSDVEIVRGVLTDLWNFVDNDLINRQQQQQQKQQQAQQAQQDNNQQQQQTMQVEQQDYNNYNNYGGYNYDYNSNYNYDYTSTTQGNSNAMNW